MTDPRPATNREITTAKHELKDVNVRVISLMALGLLLTVLVACGIVGGVFRLFAFSERKSSPPAPLMSETHRLPPEPRLQVDPAQDLQERRAVENEILNSYGWVDAKDGIVRIPIDRAMRLLVEKNSSSTPQAGESHLQGDGSKR